MTVDMLKNPEMPISHDEHLDRLITRAHQDPNAFEGVYRHYYDMVFRYCVHRLFNRERAEDITSQVFLKVIGKINTFKGGHEQFRYWLYRIATNEINDTLRKRARQTSLLKRVRDWRSSQVIDCPSSTLSGSEKISHLAKAYATLGPTHQAVITLRFFENLKTDKIAEILGTRPSTVRCQITRALAKLRQHLGPLWQES
jgi:RNA polymerase sigma-70 factor, ECF subfamily